MSSSTSGLWVVATPLGNPGDMSPRGREALELADVLLSEDTRRTGLLCQRLGIAPRKLVSLHEHNEAQKLPPLLEQLRAGVRMALVTDAGTPLLADPGYLLVRACRAEGLPVTPVPGPCAVTTALMAAGLPPYPYTFLGFLPRKSGERKALLTPFATLGQTLVFFERKDRVWESLADALEVLGPREFCIARELTKTHEEFILGRLERWQEQERELLGEVTVLLGPPEPGLRDSAATLRDLIAEESPQGGSPKDVARRVKARCSGWSVKEIYALMQRG